jgi:hypothetical protein
VKFEIRTKNGPPPVYSADEQGELGGNVQERMFIDGECGIEILK